MTVHLFLSPFNPLGYLKLNLHIALNAIRRLSNLDKHTFAK